MNINYCNPLIAIYALSPFHHSTLFAKKQLYIDFYPFGLTNNSTTNVNINKPKMLSNLINRGLLVVGSLAFVFFGNLAEGER